MILYLTRHGETDWNLWGRIQGETDNPLNQTGRRQAQSAAPYFTALNFSGCYVSPLQRARQTAAGMRPGCISHIQVDDRLTEISYGVDEGRLISDVLAHPECRLYTFFHDPLRYQPPTNGETLDHLQERCRLFLNDLLAAHAVDDHVWVCGHGTWIRGALRCLLGGVHPDLWRLEMGNCCTTLVDYQVRGSQLMGVDVPADQLPRYIQQIS